MVASVRQQWHAFCVETAQATLTGGKAMRSIRRELETKREALTTAISSSTRSSREDDHRREVFKDPFGMASITHDDEVVAAVVDTRARQLEEIDRALADIDAGRYGICRDCSQEIAKARLKILPFATRCVACQGKLETGLGRAA
jgi:DnaK suppressor protein